MDSDFIKDATIQGSRRLLENQIKKLKEDLADLPVLEVKRREAASSCIDVLEEAYKSMFLNPLDAPRPPGFENFTYHKKLIWKQVENLGDGSFQIQCTDGDMIFTLLVDRKESIRPVYKGYPETNQVIELDYVEYLSFTSEGGIDMAACLYPHFNTLEFQIASSEFSREVLQSTLKGIIYVLNYLEKNGRACLITAESLLCMEGQVGCILYTPAISFENYFLNLQSVLQKMLGSKLSSYPRLVSLLSCMEKTTTYHQRLRILQAPYFLTVDVLVFKYIDMMYSAAQSSADYTNCLKDQEFTTPGWIVEVQSSIEEDKHRLYTDLTNMLAKNSYDNTYYGFLRFLRNTVNHINEEVANAQEALQKKEDTLVATTVQQRATTVHQRATPSPSNLMSDPNLLLNLINIVDCSFLDKIFELTYGIPDLDYYTFG